MLPASALVIICVPSSSLPQANGTVFHVSVAPHARNTFGNMGVGKVSENLGPCYLEAVNKIRAQTIPVWDIRCDPMCLASNINPTNGYLPRTE